MIVAVIDVLIWLAVTAALVLPLVSGRTWLPAGMASPFARGMTPESIVTRRDSPFLYWILMGFRTVLWLFTTLQVVGAFVEG